MKSEEHKSREVPNPYQADRLRSTCQYIHDQHLAAVAHHLRATGGSRTCENRNQPMNRPEQSTELEMVAGGRR